jgi:hypothetical protein
VSATTASDDDVFDDSQVKYIEMMPEVDQELLDLVGMLSFTDDEGR